MSKADEKKATTAKTDETVANPVDNIVFGNRPNQEDLTRAIRAEVYKEVQAIFRAHDVELTEEDKARLLGTAKED